MAVLASNFDIAKCLIDNGANINARNDSNSTPLHISLENDEGNTENSIFSIVKYLIECGAQVNVLDKDNVQPIHLAAKQGFQKIVQYLIEKGAQMEGTDNTNQTPLIMAVYERYLNVVEYLIGKGANIESRNKNDQTPLIIAAPVSGVFFGGDTAIVKFLIANGAQINAIDSFGKSPLHWAVKNSNRHNYEKQCTIARNLIKNGAKIDTKDKDGATPLHLAAEKYFAFTFVQLLIENGAKISIKDNKGKTPLDIACTEEIRKYLTEKQTNTMAKETVSNQDPCIICHGPRNGFFALLPCSHASLCEDCSKKITKEKFGKCPSCRRPTKSYTKIFFQVPD